ncbi:unnamed protein product [Moneuplotes crassus]|uniref:Uncharacterized protein n=1 Tax=Euplotes crassus TaxID=5936 RepID=A0AAD1XPL1_EUPCR|nr:unnamed protein product [Moneuplotes crassus]
MFQSTPKSSQFSSKISKPELESLLFKTGICVKKYEQIVGELKEGIQEVLENKDKQQACVLMRKIKTCYQEICEFDGIRLHLDSMLLDLESGTMGPDLYNAIKAGQKKLAQIVKFTKIEEILSKIEATDSRIEQIEKLSQDFVEEDISNCDDIFAELQEELEIATPCNCFHLNQSRVDESLADRIPKNKQQQKEAEMAQEEEDLLSELN